MRRSRGRALCEKSAPRGFGHHLTSEQFRTLQSKFTQWGIPLPGGDRELVYAPLGTSEAPAYIDEMSLGGNFATMNHLLINQLVLEAFQEVIPGTRGSLVYYSNCRTYPKDEAPAAYKDFNELLLSVKQAGLASEVARLRARFVIKDSDDSLKGAA